MGPPKRAPRRTALPPMGVSIASASVAPSAYSTAPIFSVRSSPREHVEARQREQRDRHVGGDREGRVAAFGERRREEDGRQQGGRGEHEPGAPALAGVLPAARRARRRGSPCRGTGRRRGCPASTAPRRGGRACGSRAGARAPSASPNAVPMANGTRLVNSSVAVPAPNQSDAPARAPGAEVRRARSVEQGGAAPGGEAQQPAGPAARRAGATGCCRRGCGARRTSCRSRS